MKRMLLAVSVVLLLLLLGLIGIGVRQARQPRAVLLGQPDIEQRAQVIAHQMVLKNQPLRLATKRTTRGVLGLPRQCATLRVRVLDLVRQNQQRRNLCDPATTIWIVVLQGPKPDPVVWTMLGADGEMLVAHEVTLADLPPDWPRPPIGLQ